MTVRGSVPYRYHPGALPLRPTVETLVDYLRREFALVQAAFDQRLDIDITRQEPERSRTGMIRFADGVAWDPGSGPGFYGYDGSQWLRLDLDLEARVAALEAEVIRLEQEKLNIQDAIDVFSFAAYGALEAPTDSPFPNLGAAWQKIDILTILPLTPRGMVMDEVNSTFTIFNDGIYRFSTNGSVEHNSSNQGRTTQIRIYDETAGAPIGSGMVLGTGRNAEATNVAATLLLQVDEATEGHVLSLQIGNGDTYTSVNVQVFGIDINAVSEWREPIGV